MSLQKIKNPYLLKLLPMLIVLMLLLTGCLYPKPSGPSGATYITKEALRNVQGAVDQYYADHELLPIQNSDINIPKYEKFKIDFQVLQRRGYIEHIPRSAFENGGNYYYLIQNEETKPVVKVQDILLTQQVIDVQKSVEAYIRENSEIPSSVQLYEGFYQIDYTKLGKKEPQLNSLYGNHTIDLMVSTNGVVYIDYAIDIMQLLQRLDGASISEEQDLRDLLVEHYDFVPVKSTAYYFINGEPIPSIEGK